KPRKGERDVAARKPFIMVQRVQLPPGKGQPASRKRVLHVAVATPSLKRRQQGLKPRRSLDIINNLEPLPSRHPGQPPTRPLGARERRSGRGLGTGQRHRTDRLGTWEIPLVSTRERAGKEDRRLINDPGPRRGLHPSRERW